MAVHRAYRSVAWSEFERNMGILHRDLTQRLDAVPARLKKFIYPDIYNPMNRAYDALILANEDKRKGAQYKELRQQLFREAVAALQEMQKPLLSLVNLRDTSDNGAAAIRDCVNREYALIYGVAGWKEEPPKMMILPRDKIKQLAFLGVMSRLHKFTFQKIGHAPQGCYDSVTVRIKDFVTEALYDLVMANRQIPTNRQQAEEREAYINAALDNLNAMQRPLFALWNIMDYSEDTMDEWAGLIDEEIRILTGLKDKDRERYKSLK